MNAFLNSSLVTFFVIHFHLSFGMWDYFVSSSIGSSGSCSAKKSLMNWFSSSSNLFEGASSGSIKIFSSLCICSLWRMSFFKFFFSRAVQFSEYDFTVWRAKSICSGVKGLSYPIVSIHTTNRLVSVGYYGSSITSHSFSSGSNWSPSSSFYCFNSSCSFFHSSISMSWSCFHSLY